MYYFDYASTTPVDDKYITLYSKLLKDAFLHPNGNKVEQMDEEAKTIIRKSLKLNENYEVIFTSGGTEANNLAIIGFAQSFTSSKHFITTKYEHSSVYSSFKYLQQLGHSVTYLDIDRDGHINYDQLQESITDNTVLVSIMALNNEIGSVNDENKIEEIIKLTNPNCLYMSDCVQAIGKVDYDYSKLDMLTISGHKLYAPKGIGALVFKRSINIKRQIQGGEQQLGIRPGTHNVPVDVVMAVALKDAMINLDETITNYTKCLDKFTTFINEHPKTKLNVNCDSMVASVSFKTKALSESLIAVLNNRDIYASTRSACSVKLNKPSRSLSAIGLEQAEIDRTIRFSFGKDTKVSEVDYLIDEITKLLEIY